MFVHPPNSLVPILHPPHPLSLMLAPVTIELYDNVQCVIGSIRSHVRRQQLRHINLLYVQCPPLYTYNDDTSFLFVELTRLPLLHPSLPASLRTQMSSPPPDEYDIYGPLCIPRPVSDTSLPLTSLAWLIFFGRLVIPPPLWNRR